jgi:SOS-response transcriptional repressor LexA
MSDDDEQGELFDRDAREPKRVPSDALIELVGKRVVPAAGSRRFWDWYTRACRDGQTADDRRHTESGISSFVARVAARVAALDAPLVRVDGVAPRRAAEVIAPVSQVLLPARAAGAAPLVEAGVAAGAGRELWDEVTDAWVAVPAELPERRYVAMRVSGDRMTPLLHSDDVVLIDLDDTQTISGSIIVARNNDHGYVVKQVTANDGFDIVLGSLNPMYEPIRIASTSGVVLGRVVLRWCDH